jgi:hypothetical protein
MLASDAGGPPGERLPTSELAMATMAATTAAARMIVITERNVSRRRLRRASSWTSGMSNSKSFSWPVVSMVGVDTVSPRFQIVLC